MWTTFGASSRGGMHIRHDLPCQDASLCRNGEGYWITAAADGHGSRRHFRSQTGSELACRAACDCMERFVQTLVPGKGPTEIDVQLLKQSILHTWRKSVEEDAARRIWTIEELLEQGSVLSEEEYAALAQDRNPWIPYGSTLEALLVTEEFFLALQIGDGEVVTLSREGDFAWPMPESMVNQGRFTASLCMGDPMPEFRHCLSRELPAAVLAYTDGVEKAFPPHSRALVEFLYAVWRVARQGDADEVQSALEAVARLGSVKDDATLTGVINTAVDISVPRLDELQRAEELQRIHARMNECSSALAYNAARLQQMDRLTREGAAAVGQMEQIMQRCSQQLAELREAEQRLMEAADETVDMGPEEELNMIWAVPPEEADGEYHDSDDI